MSTIVEILGVVIEEARLDFGEDGLAVRVVDPSHVAVSRWMSIAQLSILGK